MDQSDCVAKVTAICASSLNRKKKGSQTGDELVFLSSAPIAVSLDDKRVSPMFFVVDWWCNNFGFFSLSFYIREQIKEALTGRDRKEACLYSNRSIGGIETPCDYVAIDTFSIT